MSTELSLASAGAPDPAGPAHAAAGGAEQLYLAFRLAGEVYAIDILRIREIVEYRLPTGVPLMPASVRGVINLRGAVVPVMDLSARFSRPSTAVTKSTCIVITEIEGPSGGERQNMGIVVDAVQAVLEIPSTEIEPPPNFGAKIRSDFIEGIAKVNGKFVILLNVRHVLSPEEIGAMGAVAGSAELAAA
jgi:purine-binding chemotaxis protein CheW